MTNILILMTTDRFSSPARLVVQTIEHCDRNRFNIMIGCTWQGDGSDSSEFFQELQQRGITLQILPQRGSFDPTPLFSATRLVAKENIDLIESHGYKACFIGFFLKLVTRKPWITVLHGHTAENRKVKWLSEIELLLARYADRIITVSAEMRRRLVAGGLAPEKTVTIPNAVDPVQFASAGTAVSRATYGVEEHETLIGVVGRFSPEKGQDIFVEAFKHLALEHASIKAIFLGEGPTESEIRDSVRKSGLESRVIFAGYQPHITAFYPLLDLIVMPSRSEGMPSVALEALYYRVPVVATAVGGTGEVIIDGQTGLLVPPEAPASLAAAIARLVSDEALKTRLAAAGYDLIQEQFLPGTRVKAFESLYESLTATESKLV